MQDLHGDRGRQVRTPGGEQTLHRELVQPAMATAGRSFLAEAFDNMGCSDRMGEIISVPDLIDFDEGRIE